MNHLEFQIPGFPGIGGLAPSSLRCRDWCSFPRTGPTANHAITDCDLWIDNKVDYKSISWIQIIYDPFRPDNPTSGVKKFEYQTETSRGSLFKVFDDDGT